MFVMDANEPKTQRQWQKDRTVRVLEQAALRVIDRDGYNSANAESISAEAGVSIRTLFRYFPHGKDDLLLLEARRTAGRIREALRVRPLSEPLALAVRRSVLSVSTQSDNGDLLEASRLQGEIARDQPLLMARMIGERQLRAEGLVEVFADRLGVDAVEDLRPRFLAHVLYGALSSAWLSWLSSEGDDLSAVIEASLELLDPIFDAAEKGPAPR